MRITLYQIIAEPENSHLIFQGLQQIKSKCGNRIPAEVYKAAYCGELDIHTPEEAFIVFNAAHPEGFRGRSMSVSDVVEFSSPGGSTFYFCDVVGCPEVEFDKSKTK